VISIFNLRKIDKLVSHYLEGVVTELKFYCISDNTYEMTIRYNRNCFYTYEYRLKINEHDETIKYRHHTCNCRLEKIPLPQEKEFEAEVLGIMKRANQKIKTCEAQ